MILVHRRGRAKAAARHARAGALVLSAPQAPENGWPSPPLAPTWPEQRPATLADEQPTVEMPIVVDGEHVTVVLPQQAPRPGPIVQLGFADGTTVAVRPELGRPLQRLAAELLRRDL